MGAAGVSAGVDIAARLGIPPAVVERARSLIAPGGRQADAFLSRLRDLVGDLEERRASVVTEQERLAEEQRRLASRAASDAERLRREAEEALEEALREFREQGKREIQAIRDKRERARLEKEQVKAEIRLRADLRHRASRLTPAAEARPESSQPFEPRPGVRVLVLSLDREGEIVAMRGDKVEVRMGTIGVTVRKSDVVAAVSPPPEPQRSRFPRPAAGAAPGPGLTDDVAAELVIIGKTVDEATPEIDRFLDRAALAGTAEVRIVHGHGTGRLRAAVRRFLRGHPHVESHRPGEPREGGDGATVVTIR
jgi:DNA mismatch repair protein MutS2